VAATFLGFFRKLLNPSPETEQAPGPQGEVQADVFPADEEDEDDAAYSRNTVQERATKDTNYIPRQSGPMLKRSGDPALKYAQLGAQLIKAIGEGSAELFKEALDKVLRRAHAFRDIADRLDAIPATVSKIQKAILTKDYGYAAQMASTVSQDASLLTDDVVLLSTALIRTADTLGKAVEANDLMSASRQIQGIITTAEQFDKAAASRAEQLMQLVMRLDRAVKTRDFALITSLSGILARDATIVAAFVHEDVTPGSSSLPAEHDLEEMMAFIGEQMATRQFTALGTTARLLVYRAGLFSDPVMAQAVQLNLLSRQLRQALLEGKRDVALALAGNIARSAGIFRGPVLERTNALLDQCLQLEQAAQHKDYAAISNLSARVARTADLLTNLQVSRASQLVQNSTKVEQAIRRFDLAAASIILDGLPAAR
jgi:hypothetical protein